jgi:transmembrane sensor
MRALLDRWRRERVRRASARWLVRMHGSDAFRWRDRFEAWRRADPLHASTYDRQLAIWVAVPRSGVHEAPAQVARPAYRYAMAASIAILVLGLGGLSAWTWRRAPETIIADREGSTAVTLADGSRVLLARGSRLEVSFGEHRRRMVLREGRVRLELVPERRPGVVRAGPVEVMTPAATVDVSVHPQQARVILLAGRVQLARHDQPSEPSEAFLDAGQLLEIGVSGQTGAPRRATAAELAWPDMMISFDDATLAEVVERANGLGFTRIELADASLGALRVTGAFRMGDNERFARSLARSLKLTVTRPSDTILRLGPSAREQP